MIKNKYSLLLIFFILFIFGTAGFVSADEINNPCSNAQDLGTCVTSLFSFGIKIAAGLAAASFVVGAIMYMMSGISPEFGSGGKDRMLGAVFGLVLLAASYAIMTTINTNLTKLDITKLKETALNAPPPPPGVYLYSDAGCQGSPNIITTSVDSIGPNVKAYSIVDDSKNFFGVILHKVNGTQNGGPCEIPQVTAVSCKSVNGMNGAMDVFEMNPTPKTSGNGITFYSLPFGPDRGSKAGYFTIVPDYADVSSGKEAITLKYSYKNVDVSDAEKNAYPTFASRPGSIDLAGDYLVALYSKPTTDPNDDSGAGSSSTYCETFTENVKNLNAEPFLVAGTNIVDHLYEYACTDYNSDRL